MTLLGTTAFTPAEQAGTWEHVASQVLGASAATITFSGLASDDFYRLTGILVKDAGASLPVPSFRLNNDTANNYQTIRVRTTGATRGAATTASVSSFQLTANLGANGYTGFVAWVSKPVAATRGQLGVVLGNDYSGLAAQAEKAHGEWNNTANLITRIDVLIATDNFAAGSSIRLDRKNAS